MCDHRVGLAANAVHSPTRRHHTWIGQYNKHKQIRGPDAFFLLFNVFFCFFFVFLQFFSSAAFYSLNFVCLSAERWILFGTSYVYDNGGNTRLDEGRRPKLAVNNIFRGSRVAGRCRHRVCTQNNEFDNEKNVCNLLPSRQITVCWLLRRRWPSF